jgi:hypothetical protein
MVESLSNTSSSNDELFHPYKSGHELAKGVSIGIDKIKMKSVAFTHTDPNPFPKD